MFTSINNSFDFGLGHKAKGKTSPQNNIFMFKNMKYVTITITSLKVALRTQNYKEWQQTSLNNHASIYKLNSLYFPSLKFIYSIKANLARNCKNSCHLSFEKEKTQKDCLIKLNFKCLWKLCHHEFFHQQHKHCKFLDFDWLFTSTISTLSFFLFSLFIGSFNPTKYSMPQCQTEW